MHRTLKLDMICGALILLFTYTAISKWMDFQHFQRVLRHSPLIHEIALPLSWFIPLFEIIASLFLLISSWRRTGLVVSLLLLTTFSLYIVYMLLFVPHLPCSCGGIIQKLSWRQHLLLNFFFMGISGVGIYLIRKPRNWSSLIPFPTRKDVL